MPPVIRACEKENREYFLLHTGQHYSYTMDRVFFEQLELPATKHNLDAGSGTHGEQPGKILTGVESVLQEERPDVVLVEGDTNTVLAGALAAAKLHISPSWACGGTGGARDGAEPHKSRSSGSRLAERSYDSQMLKAKEIIRSTAYK